MLILSTALIVGFGGLTIWLQDEKFIQIKPTAIYLLFGVLLIGGWLRGKALLQILLEAAFEGVDRDGVQDRALHGIEVSTTSNADRRSVVIITISSSPMNRSRTLTATISPVGTTQFCNGNLYSHVINQAGLA